MAHSRARRPLPPSHTPPQPLLPTNPLAPPAPAHTFRHASVLADSGHPTIATPLPRRKRLPVPRFPQPDDVSCGPTCLAQVLAGYGDDRPLSELLTKVRRNPDGGTQAVHLGQLALDIGYRARLYPLGVQVFDPTWWELEDPQIVEKLARRAEGLPAGPRRHEVQAWHRFMVSGGYIAFQEPTPQLLVRVLAQGRPLICGLNATWLYRESRTNPDTNRDDDVHGQPQGHFVTVTGYTGSGLHFHIADPSEDPPPYPGEPHPDEEPDPEPPVRGRYPLRAERLIHAILLGDGTRDAVLLEVWPPPRAARRRPETP